MITYCLFKSYRIMGGAQSGGGETPDERPGFLNISTKPISFFLIRLMECSMTNPQIAFKPMVLV
jgi:hypothetical protein